METHRNKVGNHETYEIQTYVQKLEFFRAWNKVEVPTSNDNIFRCFCKENLEASVARNFVIKSLATHRSWIAAANNIYNKETISNLENHLGAAAEAALREKEYAEIEEAELAKSKSLQDFLLELILQHFLQ